MISASLSCPFVRQNLKNLRDIKLSHAAMQCPIMGQAMFLRSMSAVATDVSPTQHASAPQPPKKDVKTKPESKVAKPQLPDKPFGYDSFFTEQIERKKSDKSYRYFNNINRLAKAFPTAHTQLENDVVQVWCSNDYLGMSRHPAVQTAMMCVY
jgi:5-aminolevulinate synthase